MVKSNKEKTHQQVAYIFNEIHEQALTLEKNDTNYEWSTQNLIYKYEVVFKKWVKNLGGTSQTCLT